MGIFGYKVIERDFDFGGRIGIWEGERGDEIGRGVGFIRRKEEAEMEDKTKEGVTCKIEIGSVVV